MHDYCDVSGTLMVRHVVLLYYIWSRIETFTQLQTLQNRTFFFIVREDKNLKESAMIKVRYQRDEPCGLTSPDLASDQYRTVVTFTFYEEMLELLHRN